MDYLHGYVLLLLWFRLQRQLQIKPQEEKIEQEICTFLHEPLYPSAVSIKLKFNKVTTHQTQWVCQVLTRQQPSTHKQY